MVDGDLLPTTTTSRLVDDLQQQQWTFLTSETREDGKVRNESYCFVSGLDVR